MPKSKDKCAWFHPTTGEPLVPPRSNRAGCPRKGGCSFLHPGDTGWESGCYNWPFAERIELSIPGQPPLTQDSQSTRAQTPQTLRDARAGVEPSTHHHRRRSRSRSRPRNRSISTSRERSSSSRRAHPMSPPPTASAPPPQASQASSHVPRDPRRVRRDRQDPPPPVPQSPSRGTPVASTSSAPAPPPLQPPRPKPPLLSSSSDVLDGHSVPQPHRTNMGPPPEPAMFPAMDIDQTASTRTDLPLLSKSSDLDLPTPRSETMNIAPNTELNSTSRRENALLELRQFADLIKLQMDLQTARERVDSVRRFSEVSNCVDTNLVDEALSGAEREVSNMKAQLDRASEEFIKRPLGLFQVPAEASTPGLPQQSENGSTTETLSEFTTRFAEEFEGINKDILYLGSIANDHIKKIEDIQDFNTKAIEVHEARHQELHTLQTVVAELEHRQVNDETTHDRYDTQMQHMESSIQDLQNGVDEMRGELDELKVPSDADRPPSQEVSSIEGRLAHLEVEFKCKIDELTSNQAAHDIQMKAFSSHLEDASGAFSSIKEKLNGMEKIVNAGSLEVNDLVQAIANFKNDVSELHTTFKRAREEESSRRQEEREERARLHQSHDALLQRLDKRDAEFHKLCARFTQLETASQNQAASMATLGKILDDVLRKSDPKMEHFFKQAEERIKTEFLPDLVLKLLRRQEENVYNRLTPRIDLLMRFIEEIYKVVPNTKGKAVEANPA